MCRYYYSSDFKPTNYFSWYYFTLTFDSQCAKRTDMTPFHVYHLVSFML